MADYWGRGRAAVRWAIVAGLGLVGLVAEARADRILLRGGGQVRGKISPDPKRADRVVVLTERGKTPLSFQKVQIVEVIPEAGPLDEYLPKRNAAAATAEGQFELGQWCEQHKLPDMASVHYEAALAYDKTFGPAHQKLGHVRYDDRWLTPDERRVAQGLIRVKGKWITREEKEQRDKDAALLAEQETWVRRLRLLREAIAYSSEDRQREAESQLMAIREPIAIPPLLKVFGNDVTRMRVLLAHILGAIPGSEATNALVGFLLDEGEQEVRNTTMDELLRRKESEVTKLLVRALPSKNPQVVNRAAWGLSNLKAVTAVPSLIGALVTVRYEVVMVPSSGRSGGGLSMSTSFGSLNTVPANGGVPMAYNGSSSDYLMGGVSNPPGGPVIGFGASSVPTTSVPATPTVPSLGMGAPMGGSGGSGGSRGPVPRMVAIPFRNVEVLAALVKLTGHDFGWDLDTWNRWVRTSYNADPRPARRVPQP